MTDIVDMSTRSRMMAGIRYRDTAPEMTVRRALHRLGFRYRLHDSRLPGRPDMVFPVRRAVIFIHGCFWHGHNCHLFRWPRSREDFWRAKIQGNRERDAATTVALEEAGWRHLTIWECALRGRTKLPSGDAVRRTAIWLDQSRNNMILQGEN